jgi:hypothetical protein
VIPWYDSEVLGPVGVWPTDPFELVIVIVMVLAVIVAVIRAPKGGA